MIIVGSEGEGVLPRGLRSTSPDIWNHKTPCLSLDGRRPGGERINKQMFIAYSHFARVFELAGIHCYTDYAGPDGTYVPPERARRLVPVLFWGNETTRRSRSTQESIHRMEHLFEIGFQKP